MSKEIKLHTKIYQIKKQLRFVRCSRVNLAEKKTITVCQECGKGFCQSCSLLSFWFCHLALDGGLAALSRGTKKEGKLENTEK